MEEILKIGREFVEAMNERRGFAQVAEVYDDKAQSVEAVVPPGRDVRVAKGRDAIKAKREDWAQTHEIHELVADGPYVHPPNQFAVRFSAEVTQKATGQRITLKEIAVYSVEDGKIIREEFFMLPR